MERLNNSFIVNVYTRCKNNKSLAMYPSIYDKIIHGITEMLKLIDFISALIFVWLFEDEYIIDSITTYTDRTVDL